MESTKNLRWAVAALSLIVLILIGYIAFHHQTIVTSIDPTGSVAFYAKAGDTLEWRVDYPNAGDSDPYSITFDPTLSPCVGVTGLIATRKHPAKCKAAPGIPFLEYNTAVPLDLAALDGKRGVHGCPGCGGAEVTGGKSETLQARHSELAGPSSGKTNIAISCASGVNAVQTDTTVSAADLAAYWTNISDDNGWKVQFTNGSPCDQGTTQFSNHSPVCYLKHSDGTSTPTGDYAYTAATTSCGAATPAAGTLHVR